VFHGPHVALFDRRDRAAPAGGAHDGTSVGRRRLRRRLARRRLLTLARDRLELGAELVEVAEALVDRREPHVRDLVELTEAGHYLLPDRRRQHFFLSRVDELTFDGVDRLLEL